MKKYSIKAYGEEYGLPTKSVVIEAENKDEAMQMAWSIFAEYEDIGISEIHPTEKGGEQE